MRIEAASKLFLNWSTGKDAAFALYLLKKQGRYQVDRLLTTLNGSNRRISMHGLREELLLEQARAVGIPLERIFLRADFDGREYEQKMKQQLEKFRLQGYTYAAFGDIFLQDLREYREQQLVTLGIKAVFPLWQKDTSALLKQFIDAGFKAVIVSANAKWFSREDVGKPIDNAFLNQLPKEVDPCGENGEFHTFCYAGPVFQREVKFKTGKKLLKTYSAADGKGKVKFWFCDLLKES